MAVGSSPPPVVSAVMAVHDGEATVAEAVRSVLNQTFGDLELIVVDDGSTDGTARVLRTLAQDARVTVLTNPAPLGAGGARNRAMAAARGEFVALADADDLSEPHRFAAQVAVFREQPDLVAVGAQMSEFGDWGSRREAYRFPLTAEAIRRDLHKGQMGVAHAAVMFRRDSALAVGGYDAALRRSEDLALFRKLGPGRMIALPEPLVRYRVERAVTVRYVWREMASTVLANRRNPFGSTRSEGPEGLRRRDLPRVALATARSWTIRSLRERAVRLRRG